MMDRYMKRGDGVDPNFSMGDLEYYFRKAMATEGVRYIAVSIEFDETTDVEVIINPIENAEYKLKYYTQMYDENLRHKYANGVKIIRFTYGHTFETIELDLLG